MQYMEKSKAHGISSVPASPSNEWSLSTEPSVKDTVLTLPEIPIESTIFCTAQFNVPKVSTIR